MTEKKQQLYDVYLTEFVFPNTPRLHCGAHSESKILGFFQRLSELKMPENSCAYKIMAHAHNNFAARAYIDSDVGNYTTDVSGATAEISIAMDDNRKCGSDTCFANIKSGRCTDPFIRDNIAGHFFAQQYQKQK